MCFLVALLLFLPLVASAPPVSFQVSSNSMQIESPYTPVIKQGTDHRFHAHAINQSSIKTNRTTSCALHVYNSTGYDIEISSQWMEFETYNGLDFAKTVDGKNFSKLGYYSFVIQCNSTTEVGFYTNNFIVTPTGFETTIQNILAEPYLLFLIAALFMIAAITFNSKRWLVKSVLFLVAILFLIMSVNSSMDYMMTVKSSSMLYSAFMLLVISASLMFILLIVYYLKSLAYAIRDSRKEKKESLL